MLEGKAGKVNGVFPMMSRVFFLACLELFLPWVFSRRHNLTVAFWFGDPGYESSQSHCHHGTEIHPLHTDIQHLESR